jgi:lysophospholipid acyltransferase (LPLAT)-like uncharacterized protein
LTSPPARELPPPRFFIDQLWLRRFLGRYVIGGYMRGVLATSRVEYFPPDYLDQCRKLEPAIYIAWHANLLATPLMAPDLSRLVNLTSPHPDGRMAGALSEAFGITTIAAAGASSRQGASGAIAGFRGLLRALKSGKSVFLAAEVPPEPGRHIAPGIVPLARKTGCPIVPVAAASTRRTILESIWDKNQLHHPFSRFAVVAAPVLRPTEAMTDAEAEAILKRDLDAAYAEALARTSPHPDR